jgi:hypothetical protein
VTGVIVRNGSTSRIGVDGHLERKRLSTAYRGPQGDLIVKTQHRVFKVWHHSPCGNFWRVKLVHRREVQLGTASDYVLERGGWPREWKCDEGIRAAMFNGIAYLNRLSNVLKPPVAPLLQHIEDDYVMLLMETTVPDGWAEQVIPLLMASQYLDAMARVRTR